MCDASFSHESDKTQRTAKSCLASTSHFHHQKQTSTRNVNQTCWPLLFQPTICNYVYAERRTQYDRLSQQQLSFFADNNDNNYYYYRRNSHNVIIIVKCFLRSFVVIVRVTTVVYFWQTCTVFLRLASIKLSRTAADRWHWLESCLLYTSPSPRD